MYVSIRNILAVGMFAVLMPCHAIAQEATPERSKLERFSGSRGNVIVRENYTVQKVGQIDYSGSAGVNKAAITFVAVVALTPGKESSRFRGVRMLAEWKEDLTRERSSRATLDLDEIDAAIAAIDYIKKVRGEWENKKFEDNTIEYTSTENLLIGLYKGNSMNYYMKVGSNAAVFYPKDESLQQIQKALSDAKALLQSK